MTPDHASMEGNAMIPLDITPHGYLIYDRKTAGSCMHGVAVIARCLACEAEGYTRCPACQTLFAPFDLRVRYCSAVCRHKAAHQRKLARRST